MSRPGTKSKHDRKQAASVSKQKLLTELIPGTTCTESEWNQVIEREESEETISSIIDDFNEKLDGMLMLRSVEMFKYKFAVEQFQQDIIHMFEWCHAERNKDVDGTYFIDLDDFDAPCLLTDSLAYGSIQSRSSSDNVISITAHNLGEPIVSKTCFDNEEIPIETSKTEGDESEKNSEEDANAIPCERKEEKLIDECTIDPIKPESGKSDSEKLDSGKQEKVEKTDAKEIKSGLNFVSSDMKMKVKKTPPKEPKNQLSNAVSIVDENRKMATNFTLTEEIMGIAQPNMKSSVRAAIMTHSLERAITETNTNKIVKNFDFRPQQTICSQLFKAKRPLPNLLGNRIETKVIVTEKTIKELQKKPLKNLMTLKGPHHTFLQDTDNFVPSLNTADAIRLSEGVTINKMNKSKMDPLEKYETKGMEFVDNVKHDLSQFVETDIKISSTKQQNLFPPLYNQYNCD